MTSSNLQWNRLRRFLFSSFQKIVVTIVDHIEFNKKEAILRERLVGKNARDMYNVDAYAVLKYPEGHSKHSYTQSDLLYWRSLFSRTKVNRAKKQYAKGFIQINFQ